MEKTKVLWVSPQQMTQDQFDDLNQGSAFDKAFVKSDGVEVISENMSLPAQAEEAAEAILQKAFFVGAVYVSGVFPAHVALALMATISADHIPADCNAVQVYPARYFAIEGLAIPVNLNNDGIPLATPRGFVHSHWELFHPVI